MCAYNTFLTGPEAVDPNIVIVGRIYLPDQPQSGDPTQAAQNWWNYNPGYESEQ
jgi:hypothetical protein